MLIMQRNTNYNTIDATEISEPAEELQTYVCPRCSKPMEELETPKGYATTIETYMLHNPFISI